MPTGDDATTAGGTAPVGAAAGGAGAVGTGGAAGEGAAAMGPAGELGAPLADRLRQASDTLEAEILRATLSSCGGNKAAAARALRIDYTTLHRKLKRHGILG